MGKSELLVVLFNSILSKIIDIQEIPNKPEAIWNYQAYHVFGRSHISLLMGVPVTN